MKKRAIAQVKLQLAQPMSFHRVLHALKQNQGKPRCLLVGTPIHGNLGDHLLTLSAMQYLSQNFGVLIEVSMECFMLHGDKIARQLNEQDFVFICGGGWMGTIWKDDELRLQQMITLFCRQKIVVLPQTAFYDPKSPDYDSLLSSMKQAISKAERICFTFRDQKSYDFARREFPEGKSYLLLPDNALLFEPDSLFYGRLKQEKKEGIYLCLREDCEGKILPAQKQVFYSMLRQQGYVLKQGSTIDWKIVPTALRNWRIRKKIFEIGKSKLMITDRLHGMIFAVLAGTPCIVLDNESKKVSGVYGLWLKNCPQIMLAQELSEIGQQRARFSRSSVNATYN